MTDAPLQDEASNAKPYSLSELAFALKRTLEDAYGFVRLRGELSKVTHHSNGHVYLTLKDDRSAIDGVVWKSAVRGLSVRPEHGLEAGISQRQVGIFLDAIIALSEAVPTYLLWRPQLRDPNDEMVLEAAVNGRADALVTFNVRDYGPAASRFGVEVLLPRDAIARIRR